MTTLHESTVALWLIGLNESSFDSHNYYYKQERLNLFFPCNIKMQDAQKQQTSVNILKSDSITFMFLWTIILKVIMYMYYKIRPAINIIVTVITLLLKQYLKGYNNNVTWTW